MFCSANIVLQSLFVFNVFKKSDARDGQKSLSSVHGGRKFNYGATFPSEPSNADKFKDYDGEKEDHYQFKMKAAPPISAEKRHVQNEIEEIISKVTLASGFNARHSFAEDYQNSMDPNSPPSFMNQGQGNSYGGQDFRQGFPQSNGPQNAGNDYGMYGRGRPQDSNPGPGPDYPGPGPGNPGPGPGNPGPGPGYPGPGPGYPGPGPGYPGPGPGYPGPGPGYPGPGPGYPGPGPGNPGPGPDYPGPEPGGYGREFSGNMRIPALRPNYREEQNYAGNPYGNPNREVPRAPSGYPGNRQGILPPNGIVQYTNIGQGAQNQEGMPNSPGELLKAFPGQNITYVQHDPARPMVTDDGRITGKIIDYNTFKADLDQMQPGPSRTGNVVSNKQRQEVLLRMGELKQQFENIQTKLSKGLPSLGQRFQFVNEGAPQNYGRNMAPSYPNSQNQVPQNPPAYYPAQLNPAPPNFEPQYPVPGNQPPNPYSQNAIPQNPGPKNQESQRPVSYNPGLPKPDPNLYPNIPKPNIPGSNHPDLINPGLKNPIPNYPDPSNSGPQNPQLNNPDPSNQGQYNPNPNIPEYHNPDQSNPGPYNRDPNSPVQYKPVPNNPGIYNPDPNIPAPYNPDPNNPVSYGPDPNNPGPHNKDPNSPIPFLTDPNNPGPYNPDPNNPGSYSPDPNNPGPYNPDPNNPGSYGLAPNNPGPYNKDPNSPIPFHPDPNNPGPYNPDPNNPDPNNPTLPQVSGHIEAEPGTPVTDVVAIPLPQGTEPNYDLIPGWNELGVPGLELNTSTTAADAINNHTDFISTASMDDYSAGIEAITTTPTHHIIIETKQLMHDLKMGYLAGFANKLMDIMEQKDVEDLESLILGFHTVIEKMIADGVLDEIGNTTIIALDTVASTMNTYGVAIVKSQVGHLRKVLQHREETFDPQALQLFNIMDASYTIDEGDGLLQTLIDVDEYPFNKLTSDVVNRKIIDGLMQPFRRTAGSVNRDKLVEMVNEILMEKFDISEGLIDYSKPVARQWETARKSNRIRTKNKSTNGRRENYNVNIKKRTQEDFIKYENKKTRNRLNQFPGNYKLNRDKDHRIEIDKRYKTRTGQRINSSTLNNKKNTRDLKSKQKDNNSNFQSQKKSVVKPKKSGIKRENTKHKNSNLHTDKVMYETKRPRGFRTGHNRYERLKQDGYNYEKSLRNKVFRSIPYTVAKGKQNLDKIKNVSVNSKINAKVPKVNKDQKRFNIVKTNQTFKHNGNKKLLENLMRYNKDEYESRKKDKLLPERKVKSKYLDLISRKRLYSKDAIGYTKKNVDKKLKNPILKNIIEGSSYSDDEKELKFVLSDALRHSDFVYRNFRNNEIDKEKKKLHEQSSYSDDEGMIKNNIYKVFGYDPDLDIKN